MNKKIYFYLLTIIGIGLFAIISAMRIPKTAGEYGGQQQFSPMLLIEHGEHEQLKNLQKKLQRSVNQIVAEVLGVQLSFLDQKLRDEAFQIKPRLWTTILYVGDLPIEHEMTVVGIFQLMQQFRIIQHSITGIRASERAAFFGRAQDEIVLLVDHNNQLTQLHEAIKRFLRGINECYQSVHQQSFFKTETWDAFPFIPHVSLGRLRVHELIEFVEKNMPEVDAKASVAKIKERIEHEVFSQMVLDEQASLLPSSHLELFGRARRSILSMQL